IEEVVSGFHSRFQARSKLYRYVILNKKYPAVFPRQQSYFCPYPLDVSLMRSESRCLEGKHNFKAFAASDKKERDPVKMIRQIKVKDNRGLITIDIEASGFLYNMARNIVGTLLEIGRGYFPRGSMKRILLSKDRTKAGPTAPARGLTLIRVDY
ncbi:MAG: tRNA pseudouridine synthase A, partial [Candidatus Omnitrophica bacterium]|nr:tRNA pseudouridine synthase A [Candidatus Omnitrophota bacterium]